MSRPLRAELPEQLLLAASAEFAELGYHQVSIEAIAQRCAVTKGAVYLHFRGKLELFLEAHKRLEEIRDQHLASFQSSDAQGRMTLRAQLRHELIAHLVFHRDHPELRRFQQILDTELAGEAATTGRDGLRAAFREWRSQLRQTLQKAARAGELGPQDPAATAFSLAASIEGALVQSRAGGDDVAHFIKPEALVDAWLSCLAKPTRKRSNPWTESSKPAGRDDDVDFRPAF